LGDVAGPANWAKWLKQVKICQLWQAVPASPRLLRGPFPQSWGVLADH